MITDVVSDYVERCKQAESAKDKIIEIRKADIQNANDYVGKYSPDRSKLYDDIAPSLDAIKDNNRYMEQARPELNKIIRKENREKFWFFIGKLAGILVIVITILAWWFPRAPA